MFLSTRHARRHKELMSRGRAQQVVLIVGDRRGPGEVRFQRWDRRARLWRAAKVCLALWAVAAICVLIPIAHFILVPAFFIAGPVAASKRLRETGGILGGEGACPACGRGMIIDAHVDEWPLFEPCAACRASVRIEAASAPARP
jgi:hypothetical protein